MKRTLSALLLLAALIHPAPAAEIKESGKPVKGLEPFDQMMEGFLTAHHAAGASLAVTRNGRLVYARAFGFANTEIQEPATPKSLFRIASISKPITSMAIMKLFDQGKLKLTDHAFSYLEMNPVLAGGAKIDPRLDKITILELLQHRGGFDRDVSTDPMFHSVDFAKLCGERPPAMQPEIIRVMEGRPLDFPPGDRYAYSNFGYCLLGRVIERISGDSYQDFVQKNVLSPLGIYDMQIGHTLLRYRAVGEVRYYTAKQQSGDSVFSPGTKVPAPYGCWCLEAMDSHGAWLATASDLVKFASSLDDPAANPLLKKETVNLLFKRPPGAAGLEGNKPGGKPADVWYGLGWQVRDVGNGKINTWHTGLLAGTSTLLVRRSDGLDWAVLFNQDSDEKGNNFADTIDPLVHQAADRVKTWPEGTPREKTWP